MNHKRNKHRVIIDSSGMTILMEFVCEEDLRQFLIWIAVKMQKDPTSKVMRDLFDILEEKNRNRHPEGN